MPEPFTIINILIAIVGWVIRSFDKINNKFKKPTIKDIKEWAKSNWLTSIIQFISILTLLYLGPYIMENGFGICIKEGSHFYHLYSFFIGYANYAVIKGFMGWLSSKTWFYNENKK